MISKSSRRQKTVFAISIFATVIFAAPAFDQVAMIKDINPSGQGINNPYTAVMNELVWFGADDGTSGDELWYSDGTEGGTGRLLDIRSGSSGSTPTDFAVVTIPEVGDFLFFTANDGTSGKELWMTDGTVEGTELLDLYPGPTSSDPKYLVAMGSLVFLVATHETYGEELWVVQDGVASVVKDINSGSGDSYTSTLTVVDLDVGGETEQWLFFSASDNTNGDELWKSDGTETGTTMVQDIRVGYLPSDPAFITGFLGRAWFRADDGISGQELWSSDGSAAGTDRFMDLNPTALQGSFTRDLVATASHLYFEADDGTNGMELWATTGTPAGTQMVTDTGGLFTSQGWSESAVIGNLLYLSASDGVNGHEPWVSDGSSAGTSMLKDVADNGSGSPGNLLAANGLLFFTGCTTAAGCELWVSDGTEGGTFLAADTSTGGIGGSGLPLTTLGDLLFFSATDDTHETEMWTIGLADVVTQPSAPVGEMWVNTGTAQQYQTGGSVSARGNNIQYRFHWDDGTTSEWLPVGTTTANHAWSEVNVFNVTAEARSSAVPTAVSVHSEFLEVTTFFEETIAEPVLDGPASGWTGHSVHFTLTGGANTADQLQYFVDWGNGTINWTNFPEGRTVELSNVWSEAAEYYTIQVAVRCAVDDTTEWMDTTIEIVDPAAGAIFTDGFESGNASAW